MAYLPINAFWVDRRVMGLLSIMFRQAITVFLTMILSISWHMK